MSKGAGTVVGLKVGTCVIICDGNGAVEPAVVFLVVGLDVGNSGDIGVGMAVGEAVEI